ncbi:helix-turn-helix domain-containing protein [Haloarcula rara]|uniref:helix-turn-helix domain-containing protein n=1 Tax=Haloarcula rara TaxID=3033387 RepID=UPI0023E84E4C|nr:helix-turn-helix domain-containing protein [Halomicroarcula sp. SHR3]
MATLADFALPPDAFPLGVVFDEFPEAAVELERIVPTKDMLQQYFWVENVPSEAVTEFFRSHTDITDVVPVDRLEDRTLFRYQSTTEDRRGVLAALVESDVTLLSATGTRVGWRLNVRGDQQRTIGDFDEACRAAAIQPTLRDIHASVGPPADRHPSVTAPQREALVLAYKNGYYAEPRETNLAELAAEVGISRQAFARRLNRGYRTLIESHLRLTGGHERVS